MGEIEISFSEPLRVIPSEIDLKTLTFNMKRNLQSKHPVFTVKIEPSAEQDPDRIGMTWVITEFTRSKMRIQMTFEQALYVSFEATDTLVIEFADPDLFITDGGIQILPEHRRLVRPLMRQLPNYAKAT